MINTSCKTKGKRNKKIKNKKEPNLFIKKDPFRLSSSLSH
jgi:hypothetical protein